MSNDLSNEQQHFAKHYSIDKCYGSPRASIPMLLHLWEQGEATKQLLKEILDRLPVKGGQDEEEDRKI